MKGFRRYKVSAKAVEDGTRLGIKGDVAKAVADMARRSANLTYPGANRRFHGYVMNIVDGVVVAVMPFDKALNEQAWAEKDAWKRSRRGGPSEAGEEG